MNRSYLVQWMAVLLAVACLAGASTLSPHITEQRTELQLSHELEGMGDAPWYVKIVTRMGSLRGLAINYLWQHAERQKQEGRLFDSNTTAQWITRLQPRFPQVWSFHAWNMAYNISVTTDTQDERWDWVSKGISLLRDEGIPYNPKAIRLYRELSWIFAHKIGRYTDDKHWYYKLRMAEEWHGVLGSLADGLTAEQALANFKPIADASDRYVVFDRPTAKTAELIEQLESQSEVFQPYAERFLETGVVRLAESLAELRPQIASREQQNLDLFDQIIAMVGDQAQRALTSPYDLLVQDEPRTAAVLEEFQEAGIDLDKHTLRDINSLLFHLSMVIDVEQLRETMLVMEPSLRRIVLRSELDATYQAGFAAVLAYLRAKVLVEDYRMDPQFMHKLMTTFGPIDWRHPAAHAAYWSAMGVRRAGLVNQQAKIDFINTDRQLIHAFQDLFNTGKISFTPGYGQIDYMPDVRFLDAYEKAVFGSEEQGLKGALDRAAEQRMDSAGTIDTFDGGHENFLHKAIMYSYMYGNTADAQAYYDKVRRLYGDKGANVISGRYRQSLDDMVMMLWREDSDMRNISMAFIQRMLYRGFHQGLGQGNRQTFLRFYQIAQKAHAEFNEMRDYGATGQDRDRLQINRDFGEVVLQSFVTYLRQPTLPLLTRGRAYAFAPPNLSSAAYPRIRDAVVAQANAAGVRVEDFFRAPPGFNPDALVPQGPAQVQPESNRYIERK